MTLSAPKADFDIFSAPLPLGWGVIPVVTISRHPQASAVLNMDPTLNALLTLSNTTMSGNMRRFVDSFVDGQIGAMFKREFFLE